MTTIEVTPEALDASMTAEQWAAIGRLTSGGHVRTLRVWKGGYGLPDGYVSIDIVYGTGNPIAGGIAPDGQVST